MSNSVKQSSKIEEQAKGLSYFDIKESYGSDLNGNPSVYCGTYAKYNDGSLDGLWLDLTKFSDYEEFIVICHQLHCDEEDPELMFQDYECFPSLFYSESCMSEEAFDAIKEYAELSDEEKEALEDFLELGNSYDLEDFRDRYCGQYDSEKDFAEHYIDECYDLEQMMGPLWSYFDYEAFARDLFITDYSISEHGYVFRT